MDGNANSDFYPQGSSAQPLQAQSFSTPATVRRFLLTLSQSEGSSAAPPATNDDQADDEIIIYPLGGSDGRN